MSSHDQPKGSSAPQGMQAYAAPSLFQPHLARKAIRDAHEKKIPALIGYYAGLSSIPITRFLAPMGYDMVWIDWEHTSCGVETMTTVSPGHIAPSCRFRRADRGPDGARNHVHERRTHDSVCPVMEPL